ncbi:hypothetical protein F5148DRAFT_1206347 [Russula earlei]|uniref:Uncharacterized protein n=1 Tax=Russula earlei TaxID=71964 RepID=A0ACC0U6N2_9AGAM|nr:hypothetical protein F5148DRAFT_1206347 [Russula earlei]
MPFPDAAFFKHPRAASTGMVDQVPRGGGREIVENRIGSIEDVEFGKDGISLEITFSNPDAATKCLPMSGYSVSGHPIIDTAISRSPPKPQAAIQDKFLDTRRNLYVLGLPFDLSNPELSAIFSHFGAVTHSVILATVDNASRRRGFVVMSTHAEAKIAMENISQTSIRGSIVDVSWAVVQRSQGFLDGGDRAVTLEGQVDSAIPASDRGSTFQTSSSQSDNSKTVHALSVAQDQSYPASIIVHNLPALLFAQDSDLEPLFCPFGEVREIRKQAPSVTQSSADIISVLVTYSSVIDATEAKVALHGQTYGDTPLKVESLWPYHDYEHNRKPGREHSSRSSLNPCASPFVFDTAMTISAPPTSLVSEDFPDYFSKPKLSGMARRFTHFSLPDTITRGHRSLPASTLPSRANSVAPWSVPPARSSFYA